MKKSIVVLFGCLMFFLQACGKEKANTTQNWGELVVNNQTSVTMLYVKYCDQDIMMPSGNGGYSTWIRSGKQVTKPLLHDQKGYLFFSLEYGNDKRVDLRTKGEFVIKKGERTVCTISNDTVIVTTRGNRTCTVSDVITSSKTTTLKIENKSKYSLKYVKYKAVYFRGEHSLTDYLYSGDSSTRELEDIDEDEYSDYLYFNFSDKWCRIAEMVTIKKGQKLSSLKTWNRPYI